MSVSHFFSRITARGTSRRATTARHLRQMIGDALEPRRLMMGAPGDVGSNDVFRPDTAAFATHVSSAQTLIDVTNLKPLLDSTPPEWGLRGTLDATPNDNTDDDSVAFNAALEFMRQKVKAWRSTATDVNAYNDPAINYALYVPSGDYTINHSIHFEEEPVAADRFTMVHVRLLGESRDGTAADTRTTIIASGLASNFQTPTSLAGMAIDLFTRDTNKAPDKAINNRPARNAVENLNLRVAGSLVTAGVGGLQVVGANVGRVRNVRITEDAPLGTNRPRETAGLTVRAPSSGLVSNVTVDGFGSGVRLLGPQLITVSLSNVTVTRQKACGVFADGGQPTIENLRSAQQAPSSTAARPPAILADHAAAVTVMGGQFQAYQATAGSTAASTAMVATGPTTGIESGSTITVFRANVVPGEYGAPLRYSGAARADIDGSTVDTLYSGVASPGAAVTSASPVPAAAFANDFSEFARVDSPGGDDFGASSTPAAASAADLAWITVSGSASDPIDLGTKGVLDAQDLVRLAAAIGDAAAAGGGGVGIHFTRREYEFTATLSVPASVRVIDFGFGFLANSIGGGAGSRPILSVAGGTGGKLVIANVAYAYNKNATGTPALASIGVSRPVVFDSVSTAMLGIDDARADPVGTRLNLWLQNCSGFLRADYNAAPLTSASLYLRGVNTEGPNRVAFGRMGAGTNCYIAGFKTEENNTNFDVSGDAKLFVFGGGSSQQELNEITTPSARQPILRFGGTANAQVFLSLSTWRLGSANDPNGDALRQKIVTNGDGTQTLLRYDDNVSNTPRRLVENQMSYDYFVPFLTILEGKLRVKETVITVPTTSAAMLASPSSTATSTTPTKNAKTKRIGAASAIFV